MSYRKSYIQIEHPCIKYKTDVTGNSLPLSLGLSLLETVARLKSLPSPEIRILRESLSVLIKNSSDQYPEFTIQLNFFEELCTFFSQASSAKECFDLFEVKSVCDRHPENESYTNYIDIASKCMLSTLMTQKLTDRGEHEKIKHFFHISGDIRDLDHPTFVKFSEYFMVAIKVYENNQTETFCIEKNATYPIIHLLKSNYLYSLGYPQVFADLRNGCIFSAEKLGNEPFMLRKNKNCPIKAPIFMKKSNEELIEYSNNDQVMSMLINCMSQELISHNIFNPDLMNTISKCLSNNETVRNIKGLVNYSNCAMGLNAGQIQKKCFGCPNIVDSTLATSHVNCDVCINCITDIRYNGRCPKCRGIYTYEDRIKLRLP